MDIDFLDENKNFFSGSEIAEVVSDKRYKSSIDKFLEEKPHMNRADALKTSDFYDLIKAKLFRNQYLDNIIKNSNLSLSQDETIIIREYLDAGLELGFSMALNSSAGAIHNGYEIVLKMAALHEKKFIEKGFVPLPLETLDYAGCLVARNEGYTIGARHPGNILLQRNAGQKTDKPIQQEYNWFCKTYPQLMDTN